MNYERQNPSKAEISFIVKILLIIVTLFLLFAGYYKAMAAEPPIPEETIVIKLNDLETQLNTLKEGIHQAYLLSKEIKPRRDQMIGEKEAALAKVTELTLKINGMVASSEVANLKAENDKMKAVFEQIYNILTQ